MMKQTLWLVIAVLETRAMRRKEDDADDIVKGLPASSFSWHARVSASYHLGNKICLENFSFTLPRCYSPSVFYPLALFLGQQTRARLTFAAACS
jgi:hypothetical protein